MSRDLAKIAMIYIVLRMEHIVKLQKWDKMQHMREISEILLAIAKGYFKQDDVHSNQVALIITELISFYGEKLPPEAQQILKDTQYRFKTTFNITTELDRVVKGYVPKELQERLGNVTGEHSNPYRWQNIDDNSLSATIKRNLEKFKTKYKIYIEFHSTLHQTKQPYKHDDRMKHNFYYIEI